MIEVIVNGDLRKVPTETTISDIIVDLGLAEARGIAVALNQNVVLKNSWASEKLIAQDKVTIIRATQGG